MKKVTAKAVCSCGYEIQRMFYTGEYGYFEIPSAYCPICFYALSFTIKELPTDTNKEVCPVSGAENCHECDESSIEKCNG